MRYMFFILFVALAGCVHPTPKYTWQNSSLSPSEVESKRAVDMAECEVHAHQAVPLPALPPSELTNSSNSRQYTVNGQTNGYNIYGDSYSGTYTATITEEPSYQQNAFQQGMAYAQESYARDLQIEQYEDAVNKRANYVEACMIKRGWVKVAVEME